LFPITNKFIVKYEEVFDKRVAKGLKKSDLRCPAAHREVDRLRPRRISGRISRISGSE